MGTTLRSSYAKKDDDVTSKAASRILNISGNKTGAFAFPKRERFNEEVEKEIQSQKSNQRVHSQLLSSKSLVVKGDTASNRSSMMNQSQRFSKASSKVRLDVTDKSARFSSKSRSKQPSLKLKYQRNLDCGNPRYYADKADSQVGLLCGQKSRPNGFASVPSEIPTRVVEKTPSKVPEENVSEISYQDELASQGDVTAYEETQSNVGGGMLMTWGTGFQKGMKLGPGGDKLADMDKMTVATSALEYQCSLVSNASTGFYSRECKRLEQAVQEQRMAREKLEAELEQHKMITTKTTEMLNM